MYWTSFWVALVANLLLLVVPSSCGNRQQEEPQSVDSPSPIDVDNNTDTTTNTPTNSYHNSDHDNKSSVHQRLVVRYLAVYFMASLADWLQGPYVYALYATYGYPQRDIARLFCAGFAASMILGTVVGQFADAGGRRRFVVLYAVMYGASCVTKHVNDFWILLLGRILGGIATSLLFSVFESWLIRAHADHGLLSPTSSSPSSSSSLGGSTTMNGNGSSHGHRNSFTYVSQSLTYATYGNSIVAIVAGLLANTVADRTELTPIGSSNFYRSGGYLAPFDVSIGALVVCGVLALLLWEENYGSNDDDDDETTNNNQQQTSLPSTRYRRIINTLNGAGTTLLADPKIILLGIISSLFEGHMYIFVFFWTPALVEYAHNDNDNGNGGSSNYHDVPFGVIFSTFMICTMMGSRLNMILLERCQLQAERVTIFVLGLAAACLAIMGGNHKKNSTAWLPYTAMNGFELCVGMYYPLMGILKGRLVPERHRAAIYNLFRIPLNAIVLVALLNDFSVAQSFRYSAMFLTGAMGLQILLARRMVEERTDQYDAYHAVMVDEEEDCDDEGRLELS